MFKELIKLSELEAPEHVYYGNATATYLARKLQTINTKLKELEQRVFINIPEEKIEKLVEEIFQNFPEYGCYSFKCIKYDYDNFDYWFRDIEEDDNVVYKVSKQQAVQGFKNYIGSSDCNVYFEDMLDGSVYDADLLDEILQYTLFGEIRYC